MPTEQVDLGEPGSTRSPAYTAINPLQRVPALVLDDGTVITESIAICRYFEALQPEPALFGHGAMEIARGRDVEPADRIPSARPVSQVFRNSHPAMKEMEVPQVPAWAEANKPRVLDFLALLDRELGDAAAIIAGEHYPVADITGDDRGRLHEARQARQCPDDLTNLKRWHAEVSARPSAKA